MMQQVTTIAEKKDATKVAQSQLDRLSVRMTVAVLRKALSDNADALTLWKVADPFAVALNRCHKPTKLSAPSIGRIRQWLMMMTKRFVAFVLQKPLKR